MRKTPVLGLVFCLCLAACPSAPAPDAAPSLKGYRPLFDGESLDGWRFLREYSGAAGFWTAEDGCIVGAHRPEGKWEMLVTEKTFENFEIYAEVKADYPIDSGLFLRLQPSVLSYQITIDFRPEGEIGALYCPTGGGFLAHNPEGWAVWKKDAFNRIHARIVGQPPRIEAWINGKKLLDYTDVPQNEGFRVPRRGHIALQVHPGPGWGDSASVYFRKILIKEL